MMLYQNLNTLGDHIGYTRLIGVMGSDLEIVNDARVSYNSLKTQFDSKDEKLIKFLITHKHNSPMRGSVLKFEVMCPLFIARQWWKHHVSSNYVDSQDGWNEQSLRYTEGSDFYVPREFREQSKVNKQSSTTPVVLNQPTLLKIYAHAIKSSLSDYEYMLTKGVCREQARGLLPTATYTKFRWTTSLEGALNFIRLRDKPDAQWEIQQYASDIRIATAKSFPVTLKYFLGSS